jgi:hypothetical protein
MNMLHRMPVDQSPGGEPERRGNERSRSSGPGDLSESGEARFWRGAHDATKFFMGTANVQKALDLGRGYVERFPRSRGMRDTEHGVDIDVVLTGGYPGDGKAKPVAFPDPGVAAERGARVALLPLPILVELKLASGLTAPHRLRDLADVQELIRVRQLPRDLSESLDPFVRDKYLELWQAVADHPEDEVP